MQKRQRVLWITMLISLFIAAAAGCGPDYRLEGVTVESVKVDFQPLTEKPRITFDIEDKGKILTFISLDASPSEITLVRSVQKGDKIILYIDRHRQTGNIIFKDIFIISRAPQKVPEAPKAPEKKKGWSLFSRD
jgi:hypothetical protein